MYIEKGKKWHLKGLNFYFEIKADYWAKIYFHTCLFRRYIYIDHRFEETSIATKIIQFLNKRKTKKSHYENWDRMRRMWIALNWYQVWIFLPDLYEDMDFSPMLLWFYPEWVYDKYIWYKFQSREFIDEINSSIILPKYKDETKSSCLVISAIIAEICQGFRKLFLQEEFTSSNRANSYK